MREGIFYVLSGVKKTIGNDKTPEEYFAAYQEERKKWAENYTSQIVKTLKTAHRLGVEVYVETYNRIFKEIVPKFCLKGIYEEYATVVANVCEACCFFEETFQECASEVSSDFWLPKPNFLYVYFEDRFKDDCRCIVTKADLNDIIDKCNRIADVDVALNDTKEEIDKISIKIKSLVNSICNQTKPDEECIEGVQTQLKELQNKYEELTENRDRLSKIGQQAPSLLPGENVMGIMACGYDDWYYGNIKTCVKELPLLLEQYNEETDVLLFVWES